MPPPRRPLPRPTLLHGTLTVSVLLHLGVLGFRLVDPVGFDRLFKSQPLEVVLVNARGDDPPRQAPLLAQTSMDGGGQLAEGRSTSPLPTAPDDALGDAPEEALRRVEQLQQQQQQLLAQVHRDLARLPPPDPQAEAGSPEQQALEERRRQLLKLLAEIEKRINDDSAKPRKRYVSPATREVAYALYYDRLRRRIEERGTRDFPVHQGQKLYGDLTMNITLNAHGEVVAAEVVQPSGSAVLDRRAVAIVRASAPFGGFTDAMRAQADQIVVSPRFRFTRDEGLATSMAVPQPAGSSP